MRITRLVVIPLSLALACCSSVTTPNASRSQTADPSATSQPTSLSATPTAAALDGRWTTGAVPIADIEAAMVEAGMEQADVDAWVTEVGSPDSYAFELEFASGRFTHRQMTPGTPMQVDEDGTFSLAAERLTLSVGEPGSIDTYTFAASITPGTLSLRLLDSSDSGSAEDQEHHRRYTIAFYCSAVFDRRGS
jgi:hypothetical protein